MADCANQVNTTAWLEGPARLTKRQLDLISQYDVTRESAAIPTSATRRHYINLDSKDDQTGPAKTRDQKNLIESIELEWKPNDILIMFQEEKAKIIQRDKHCQELLVKVEAISGQISMLKQQCKQLEPSVRLYSDCKETIKERQTLLLLLEKTSSLLSKQSTNDGQLQVQSDGTIITRMFDYLYKNYL